jgi:hypothetical protein
MNTEKLIITFTNKKEKIMKNLFLIIMLTILVSASSFAQNTYTRTEVKAPDTVYVAAIHNQGHTRIGVIGNIWHPVGLIVNHQFDGSLGFGLYASVKSDVDEKNLGSINQYNITGGVSIDIFSKTCDLLVGASYTTEPSSDSYKNHCYSWGVELLLMTPFFDENWRAIVGWSSNSVVWAEGFTAGFAYQF